MGEDRRTEGEALVALQVRMDGLELALKNHVDSQQEQFKEVKNTLKELMDKVNNRLPIWVTVTFMLLTGVIGWLVKG